MNNLPVEVFAHLFSFLDVASLSRVASVCSSWNDVQKIDYLWANHYMHFRTVYPNLRKIQNTYKDGLRAFANWKRGAAEVVISEERSKPALQWHFLSFIDGNIERTQDILEIYRSPEDPLKIIIKNRTRTEALEIDLRDFQFSSIVDADCNEGSCVFLDQSGKVVWVDLDTKKIGAFKLEKDFMYVKECHILKYVKIHGDAILVNQDLDKEIYFIDKTTCDCRKIPYFGGDNGYIDNFAATLNYIIYSGQAYNDPQASYKVALEKKDQTHSLNFTEESQIVALTSSAKYLAVSLKNGTIKVYQETEMGMDHCLELLSLQDSRVSIYQEWLFIMQENRLQIWDISAKNKFSDFKHAALHREFCISEIMLMTFYEQEVGRRKGHVQQLASFNFASVHAKKLNLEKS